jgi:D-glycero-alpha-D-manno-heptose 1-phosphate guanylyltransferase
MIQAAIILAGGFGTRLQTVVKDIPKPMAPIRSKPFLAYLIDYCSSQKIRRIILSTGYKHEVIQNYFGSEYKNVSISYSIEDEPLGTGGAILKAALGSEEEEFFILNGDTFFNINFQEFYAAHSFRQTHLSLALKTMKNFDRYGAVITDASGKIISFTEKSFYAHGNINGGIYILNKKLFSEVKLKGKFSFEKDLMEQFVSQFPFYGFPFDDYFIDIGIPEDYRRAQNELTQITGLK